jgi:hypothetical protein
MKQSDAPEDEDKQQAVVNAVMNLCVPYNMPNFVGY